MFMFACQFQSSPSAAAHGAAVEGVSQREVPTAMTSHFAQNVQCGVVAWAGPDGQNPFRTTWWFINQCRASSIATGAGICPLGSSKTVASGKSV